MDGLALLTEAKQAGLVVLVDGERLRIRGPRRAESIAQRLIDHKALVIEALANDLPAEWHFHWDERAAIMEYDGKIPREQAEALALAEIRNLIGTADERT